MRLNAESQLPFRLVLMPGMDGTGRLFAPLIGALSAEIETSLVVYPADRSLSELEEIDLLRCSSPAHQPFILLAESYSTPLGIRFASKSPPNLAGVILCAGFGSSPIRGAKRIFAGFCAPFLFRLPLSDFSIRRWLLGATAEQGLVDLVRDAVSSVSTKVLAARLREILRCDVTRELRQVSVPILHLQPTADRLIGARCLDEILRIQPDTSVIKVEGPHLLLQAEPKACAEAILEFSGALLG